MLSAQPSSVATRNGVIAGVILGILSLPIITVSAATGAVRARSGLALIFLLIALVVFAVAGFSASRRNGLLRSGVWAGFLAALITTFIAVCLGIVIVTLLAPSLLAAVPAAQRGVARPVARLAIAMRLAFQRLTLGGLVLLVGGLLAGLVGGLLGRIGRRGGSDGGRSQAAYVASDASAQAFSAPTMPTPPYAQPSTPPMGQAIATPPAYYPQATPYDDSSPTTVRESQP
ncbi:MAG TPA: hypothetical protein VFN78_13730 [Ktedonobacterales bacterium]|nr:hypothetical protein [Ktedonobacterales bacterium]